MKNKFLLSSLILFLLCSISLSSPFYVSAQESETSRADVDVHASYTLLMDAKSGRVLYEKDGYKKVPMASTTKIMTCIIALEYGNLDSEVIVSANAAKQPKVHLKMKADETYILRDLIYSLMLESHNDTAVAIAEHVGGSVEDFAALMNQKARDVGAYNTNFVTPNGLDADGHETTAADLALITRYALANETFREIITAPSHSFSTADGSRSFTVNNKDSFLRQMDGAIGVKTGFTNNAGYCFVGALERDDRTYISVVLASGWPPNKSWKWSDTKKLISYGLDNYNYEEIFSPVESFGQIPVNQGQQEVTDTYIMDSLTLLVSADDNIDISYHYKEKLEAPVEKDQTIGFASVKVNEQLMGKYPIRTKSRVDRKDFRYWFDKILGEFWF